MPFAEVPMREKKFGETYHILPCGNHPNAEWCVKYTNHLGEKVVLHHRLTLNEAYEWLTKRSPGAEIEIQGRFLARHDRENCVFP